MKIISLHIEDFGCFSDRTFDFSGGVNLVAGENESGKSTLISFIKFILYGMPKKSSETAAYRSRAISWQMGTASGSMEIESGGKSYTVSRRGVLRVTAKRESYSEECTIVDEALGIEVHKGECPGELFLGVPLSVFESTCFVRQLGSGDIDTEDVSRSLENMLVSADESLNLQKALEKIDAARKLYRHKNGKGGSIPELESEEASLKTRLARAMDDYNKILSRVDSINDMKSVISEKRTDLDRLEDLSSALGMVTVIKRFDLLHKTEGELSAAETALADYRNACVASYGSMPTESHASALGEANAAQKNAEKLLDAAQKIRENAENATQKFKSEYFAAFNENVRRVTDQKAVCDAIRSDVSSSKKKKKSAKLCFIISAVAAIASVASFAAFATYTSFSFSYVTVLNILLSVGAVSAVIFAGALALGILNSANAKKLSAKADASLSEYGVSAGEPSERLDALRITFKKYTDGLSRLSEHEHSVSLADSAKNMRKSDLDACRAATASLMNKWNGGCDEPLAAAEKAREIISRVAELEADEKRLSFSVAALTAELSEYDEKDVRGRVPAAIVEKFTAKDIEKVENEKRFVSMSLKQLSDKCLSAERELIMLEKETENPTRLSLELESVKERRIAETLTLDALVLASESLSLASSNIRSTVTPAIKSRAGEFMSVLTDDKYSSIGIDEEYNMSAQSESGTRSVALLSAGTQDLAYISLRMALLSLFYKDELPPLALDDALTQLDDRRAKNALRLLAAYAERGGQSILFTCHTREEAFLKEICAAKIVRL